MGTRKVDWAAEARARPAIVVQYRVGSHVIDLTGKANGWTALVDGVDLKSSFGSSADAWTAGVTEAHRLDRIAGTSLLDKTPG